MVLDFNWWIKSLDIYISPDGYHLDVYTWPELQLKMIWTSIEPRRQPRTYNSRGETFLFSTHWCFVDANFLDEKHPGEHLTHIFIWPGLQRDKPYWYRFVGYVGGQLCVSQSPVFSLIYPGFCITPLFIESWFWLGDDQPDYRLLFTEEWG